MSSISNHKKPPATMPALPVDVIIEIFCRLPVKSLLRFRCLSKQFRSIIDGPDFINRHLQNQSLDQRLIVHGKPSELISDLFSLDFDSANNVLKLEQHPFESWGFDYTLIGSCNGLLALSHRRRISVGLWNISTRKHQILPKFWTDLDVPRYAFDLRECVFDGFGYDVTSDDYKWVRVVHFHKEKFTEVTVYSLKTNSWRRIEDLPPYPNYTVYGIGVLVGGALNWLVIDRNFADQSIKYRILSFDLKSEKFRQVPIPYPEQSAADIYLEAVAFRGCLCVSYFSRSKMVVDMWVMKEYGVEDSWTKLFSFTRNKLLGCLDLCFGIRALAYSKCGDKVVLYHGNGKVFWHDLEKETNETVEINRLPTIISRVTFYVDSLISPNVNI